MRNAFIVLGVAALVILVAGALNNSVAFDVDYVAGTVSAVSLFWVSAVVAAVVFVAGGVAVWVTQRGAGVTFRKLERELQTTYERLREAEALAARPAPAPVTTTADDRTVVAATAKDDGADVTVAAGEAETVVAPASDGADAPDVPAEAGGRDGAATVVGGSSQTAVTMVSEAATGVSPDAGAAEGNAGGDTATQGADSA